MVLGDTKDDQSYNPSITHLLQAVRLSNNAPVAAQFFGDSNPHGILHFIHLDADRTLSEHLVRKHQVPAGWRASWVLIWTPFTSVASKLISASSISATTHHDLVLLQ